FTRPLDDEWELLVHFEPQHMHGLGKAFVVEVGIRSLIRPAAGFLCKDKLFRLFGFGRSNVSPEWTYVTQEELEEELAALVPLLRHVLALLDESFRRYLSPLPTELPDGILRRGPLTAREAKNEI